MPSLLSILFRKGYWLSWYVLVSLAQRVFTILINAHLQCQDVVAFIQYKVGFINVDDYEVVSRKCFLLDNLVSSVFILQSISKLTDDARKGRAQECINALTFIMR